MRKTPDTWTADQAAKAWGMLRTHVASLCAGGRVPGAYKNGGRWAIPPQDKPVSLPRGSASVETTRRDRLCIDCGITFPGGPTAKRCPACRKTHRKWYSPNRKVGNSYPCYLCGHKFLMQANGQRYCPDCGADRPSYTQQRWVSSHKANPRIDLGQKIRNRRIAKGMTQDALAQALGYAARSGGAAISQMEAGAKPIPLDKLPLLAAALDLDTEDLT